MFDKKGKIKIDIKDKITIIHCGFSKKYQVPAYAHAQNTYINNPIHIRMSNQDPLIKSVKVIFLFSFIVTLNLIFLPNSSKKYSNSKEGINDVITKPDANDVKKAREIDCFDTTALLGTVTS
ncbi:MAG: hypothetical protein K2L48_02195 [Mycoplasmoidaceae bacterium]|nr:hypothetical protein [Mycoplasmoidaceae bacterium]